MNKNNNNNLRRGAVLDSARVWRLHSDIIIHSFTSNRASLFNTRLHSVAMRINIPNANAKCFLIIDYAARSFLFFILCVCVFFFSSALRFTLRFAPGVRGDSSFSLLEGRGLSTPSLAIVLLINLGAVLELKPRSSVCLINIGSNVSLFIRR